MTLTGRRRPPIISELQFGHSVAAVDDFVERHGITPLISGFNSATASPPWMTPLP